MARRVRIYKPGGWDRLLIEDFVCPDPADDEVKIDVKAAGINFADVCVRQGLYSSAKEFIGWPITPGFEVAGIISAVGKKVKGFKKGDRVMAASFFSGYSSQLVTKSTYVRLIVHLYLYHPGILLFYNIPNILPTVLWRAASNS